MARLSEGRVEALGGLIALNNSFLVVGVGGTFEVHAGVERRVMACLIS